QGQTVTSTQIQNFTSSSDYYSWQWLGTFRSAAAGTYNFCTASDDASHLWVGATAASGFTVANAVVNNGGLHAVNTRCGNVTLSSLTDYPIRIQFGEWGGGDLMSVYFTPPGGSATYNGTGYFYSGGGLTKTVGDQPFTPTIPSSVSTGAITYSSSNPAVAAINSTSGLITVLSGGTTTITAEQAATSNYNSSTVSTTLTVLNALIVTTDEQGGSAINNVFTPTGGLISSSPGTPTRSGYTFNGWFTASSGGSALSFPYTHNQTADFTLYAQWTYAGPTCATGGTCVVGNTGPGGGIVFYVHPVGTFACGSTMTSACKYLEAAPTTGTNAWADSSSQYPYSPYRSSLIGVSGQGSAVGTGYRNTQAMIDQGPLATDLLYAGAVTRAYRGPANLTDWYLPSSDELEQLWLQSSNVGLSGTSYISSTEYDSSNAYRRYGPTSADGNPDGKRWEMYVRPIRAFG
ncbi:MAG: InlB B-repeat-containing protein, partial [Ilumatobacteraceae bacterium]|nr:InlB B-repeat-containing protein [Ilumatobacteraceae bacterium]